MSNSGDKDEDNSVDKESTLFKFAQQKFGVELFRDVSDVEKIIPCKPCGKRSINKRGNTKLNLDCYGLDIAPMNIFENQVIPVGIHNLSKSF